MTTTRTICALIFALSILSFVADGQKTKISPNSKSKPGTAALTRIDSIAAALSSKHYFTLKEEGFRIQLPSKFSSYEPSKPLSTANGDNSGQVVWDLREAHLVILFYDLGARMLTLTPEQKNEALAAGLDGTVNKDGTTTISSRDLTVNGLPAKEVRLKEGNTEFIVRDLFVGTRLFIFSAGLNSVKNADTILKQALDTFEPLKN